MQLNVSHIAGLARLELAEDEKELFSSQLGKVLEHIEELSKLDTTDIPPTSHVLEITNVLREDVVRSSQTHDEAMSNAPDRSDNFFRVPKIIE